MVGSAQAGPISIAMVTVGDSGNAADANLGFGAWGAVKYVYQIGKYDVTAGQYAAFLNAVAPADTYGLYTSYMANGFPAAGIIQSGNSGSYSYSVVAGHENFPINFITWGDAARFSNWLQNGQPNGAEGPGTTETGAYTLNGATSVAALMAVTRNSGAMWFIPTEDEWYKAAYYKGGGVNAGYWTYPTQSDTAPINTLPDTGNHANIYDSSGTGNGGYTDPNNFLTTVGAFNLSPGPYNTFDQGGDIFQWNETAASPGTRGLRGGSFDTNSSYLSSFQGYFFAPTGENFRLTGFRVASIASVPESSSVILLVIGIVALTVARRRRPRR
ncbi:MAG TPA: SUMF1/EgtB/PvdO family nonheme iron enzyme [Pirellulales bacterium]|jgi:formylglycine-generating enzyme required for sulfatase activity|nr:SUMF1/EgtB/PvdO family nonheme iron enzyme [Pirellulales bacterium]